MIPTGFVDNEKHMKLFDENNVLNSICNECEDCDTCEIRFACQEARNEL